MRLPDLRVVCLCLLAFVAPLSAAQAASRRVALVVGVSHYQHAPALDNPLHDAQAMEAMLKRLAFDVETVVDPSRAELEAATRRFGARAAGADVALFHFSGHALEAGGRNWILPKTFDTVSAREMPFEAVDLSTVIEQTTNSARVSLVFLDACRNNPFAPRLGSGHRGLASHGLGEIANPAAGLLIAFATAPGEVAGDGSGRNSPFTTALLGRLETPGVEIKTLMGRVVEDVAQATDERQRPWMTFTLKGDFYLSAPSATAAAPPSKGAPDAELLFWQSIMTSADAADFRAYLARFPNGLFAELAQTRLARLAPAQPSPAAAAEPVDKPRLMAVFAAHGAALDRSEKLAAYYLARGDHRVLAVSDKGFSYRTQRPTLEEAEGISLEACQIFGGQPCSVATRDGYWVATKDRSPRSMPHVAYEGLFDPDQIPVVGDDVRQRPDVRAYRGLKGAKAAALLPSGGAFVTAQGDTQRGAEENALAQCLKDPARFELSGPCLLYAAGDQVVLPRQLSEPATPR